MGTDVSKGHYASIFKGEVNPQWRQDGSSMFLSTVGRITLRAKHCHKREVWPVNYTSIYIGSCIIYHTVTDHTSTVVGNQLQTPSLYVVLGVCVWCQGWMRGMYDKMLVWAPRGIYLMIISYQVIPFLWFVLVAQLAGRTSDPVTRRV